MGCVEFNGSGVLSRHDDGLPSGECSGLLAGAAAAAPGHVLAIEIANMDSYPGKTVGEDGSHNFSPIPADLDATVFVDGDARSVPDPLLVPPPGKQYRMIFSPAGTGLVPDVSDGTLLMVDSSSRGAGTPVSIDEHGSITLG